MNNRFRILFYFKKPKKASSPFLPIYMRITIDSRRMEISTQRKWEPSRWNAQTCKAIGTKEDARTLNAHLDTLLVQVYEAHRQLIANGEPVTLENMRMRLDGRQVASKSLIEVFEDHNHKIRQLVNKDYADGTYKRYETALKHTISFLNWKYKASDIDINDLNYEFVSEMEFWLKSVRNCGHNSAMKYISNVKKIVHVSLKNGWLNKDPFIGYKISKREVVRDVLTMDEVNSIATKTFVIDRLQVVCDIFLLSCFTGLAYADVKKLKSTDIGKGDDGESWIFTQRTKTDTPSRIPLLPRALDILMKYRNHPVCEYKSVLLPVSSNQKMNAYLKEIADVCGINKKMTFHTARHTFATTITLTNGVPIESVGKMLGHRNLKTTQHCAKILDKKVSDDMMQLRQKLEILKPPKIDEPVAVNIDSAEEFDDYRIILVPSCYQGVSFSVDRLAS